MSRRRVGPIQIGVMSWTVLAAWGVCTIAEAAGPRDYDGPRDTAAADAEVPEAKTGAAQEDDEPGDDEPGDRPSDAPSDAPNDAPSDAPGDAPSDAPGDDVSEEPEVKEIEPDLTELDEAAGAPTKSAPPPWLPRHSIILRNFTAGRINPLGLVNELTFGYRLQLVSRDTPLFRDTYALLGLHGFLTPAFARVGPTLEVQPLAAINFGVTYDFVGAFGNLSQVASFASPTDRWGPDEIRRNTKAKLNYASTGHLVTVSGLLQARVKDIAFRTATRAMWVDMKLQGGDRVFYDQALDIPMPDRGWTVINETDLVYMFDRGRARGLRIAIRHSITHAFYQRRHFGQAEPASQPNGPTLRLGPAAGYVFFDRPGARFNRPMVFVLSQWWLRHRWRTGEQVHPAVPYFAVGFQFEGELWPHRKGDSRRRRRR